MTLKSLIAPLAVAGLLALSAMPASAAVFVEQAHGLTLQRSHSQSVTLANLTPAQRTVLVDQCRQLQSDLANGTSGDDSGNAANPQTCNEIGIPVA
jgi:hypothetical protein